MPRGGVALDVGAGTGKFTRALARGRLRVVAVEPTDEMRREFRRVVRSVPMVGGRVEHLPIRTGSVDLVTVAQAFHWFPARRALGEFARVLRPSGGVALVWNRRDRSVPWMADLTKLLDEYDPGIPRVHEERWRPALRSNSHFLRPGLRGFHHIQRVDLDTMLARVLSISYIGALPAAQRRVVSRRVIELVKERGLAGRGGRIPMPYVTEVYTLARRRPRAPRSPARRRRRPTGRPGTSPGSA